MEAKFIKCDTVIVNVNDILSIRTCGQRLTIECTNNTHDIYFSSEHGAEEELSRIFSILSGK